MNIFLTNFHAPQQSDLRGIARQFIGCLQNHGFVPEHRMIHNAAEGLQTQAALTQACVAILMAAERIFRVVDVQCLQPVKANDPVEFRQYTVQVIYDVITAVIYMALCSTQKRQTP